MPVRTQPPAVMGAGKGPQEAWAPLGSVTEKSPGSFPAQMMEKVNGTMIMLKKNLRPAYVDTPPFVNE